MATEQIKRIAVTGGDRLSLARAGNLFGAGRMGEVYLGEDTRLGRKVVIQVLPAEFGQTRSGWRASSEAPGSSSSSTGSRS